MRRRILLLSALAALGAVASCVLGPEARISVLLPALPEPWRVALPDLRCLLVWTDGSGVERAALLAGWESGAVISCDKAGNTPLLAYPVSAGELGTGGAEPGSLRPAGGMYPGSLVGGPRGHELRLTWGDGAAASVLQRLRSVGRDTSLLNAARLSEELREAADPWDLDLAAIAEAIAGGQFTVYDIDELPLRDVAVASGEGEWVLESPFRDPIVAGPDGIVLLRRISLGAHRLSSLDGRVVRIEVRERETIALRIR